MTGITVVDLLQDTAVKDLHAPEFSHLCVCDKRPTCPYFGCLYDGSGMLSLHTLPAPGLLFKFGDLSESQWYSNLALSGSTDVCTAL